MICEEREENCRAAENTTICVGSPSVRSYNSAEVYRLSRKNRNFSNLDSFLSWKYKSWTTILTIFLIKLSFCVRTTIEVNVLIKVQQIMCIIRKSILKMMHDYYRAYITFRSVNQSKFIGIATKHSTPK